MKKITLFLVALFVAVSAMAQIDYPIVYSLGEHADFASWESSYSLHTLDYPEAVVTFEKANKQPSGNAIDDIPVTKGNYVQLALKDASRSITAIKLVARQWNTKAQTITLNAGSSESNLSATSFTSQNFLLETTTLPENTSVVRFTFSSSSNQIGIESISFVLDGAVEVAVKAPIFSVAGGLQEKAFDLEITCPTDGADIYYTLNGGAETKYTSAVNISTTTKVKAWAVKGEDKSREVETTYYFNEYVENATVKQLLDAEVSDYKWYQLTGTIKEFQLKDGTTDNAMIYGNFYLEDATGVVYVYGLTATKQSSNDKSFSTLGLNVGDEITIWGTRSEYKGEAQVGGPAYMDEFSIEYAEVANIKEFIAKADSTGYTRIAGTVNVTVQNGKQVYVQDATGALVIYGATATYSTGDALTGVIGKFDNYNGTPEMVSPIFPKTVEAGTVTPQSVLLKDVNAALVSHYIKVVGEVAEDITFVTDSASNMTLRDAAGNTVIARNKFKFAAEFFEGDLIEVVAVVDLYQGEVQLGVISYDWADEFPTSVENVAISNIYTENGMVVADCEISIFNIAGQDVTAMNGRLENGVYIVKTANSAVKVVVK